MLHKLFLLIDKLQDAIGNECQVSFSKLENLQLLVRVDWWKSDHHFQTTFNERRLMGRENDDWLVAEIIVFAQESFNNREKSNA